MLTNLNRRLAGWTGGGALRIGAIGSISVKICNAAFALALAIVLAANLRPAGYGVYAYVLAVVTVLSIPAQVGLPNLVIRETAKAQANADWSRMRGLWRWASFAVGALSLFLAVAALIAVALLAKRFSPSQIDTFLLGIILIPLAALGNLRGAALRGLRHTVIGQLPEAVLRPGFQFLLVLAAISYFSPARLSPPVAMALNVIAATLSFGIGAALLWRARPAEIKANPKPAYASRAWLAASLPLALISGIQLVDQNIDVLVLGLFRSHAEVGIYKIVYTGASLVTFIMQPTSLVISPHIARLYAQGDLKGLQRIMTLSTRAILFCAAPAALVLVIFGGLILHLVFGADYIAGRLPLAILAIAQLANAATGCVTASLIMTGHEKDAALGVGIGALINTLLDFTLIPHFGMAGAACASATSVLIWNVVLRRSARRRLGIETLPLNISRLRRRS